MKITEFCEQHNLKLVIQLSYDNCVDYTDDLLRDWEDQHHTDGDLYVTELTGFGYRDLEEYKSLAGCDPDFKPDPFNMFIFEDTDPEYAKKFDAYVHAEEEAWRMYREDRYREFPSLREAIEFAVTRISELEDPTDWRTACGRRVSVMLGDSSGSVVAYVRHRWDFDN